MEWIYRYYFIIGYRIYRYYFIWWVKIVSLLLERVKIVRQNIKKITDVVVVGSHEWAKKLAHHSVCSKPSWRKHPLNSHLVTTSMTKQRTVLTFANFSTFSARCFTCSSGMESWNQVLAPTSIFTDKCYFKLKPFSDSRGKKHLHLRASEHTTTARSFMEGIRVTVC